MKLFCSFIIFSIFFKDGNVLFFFIEVLFGEDNNDSLIESQYFENSLYSFDVKLIIFLISFSSIVLLYISVNNKSSEKLYFGIKVFVLLKLYSKSLLNVELKILFFSF